MRRYATARKAQDYQRSKDALSFFDVEDASSAPDRAPQYALLTAAFLEFESGAWVAAREVYDVLSPRIRLSLAHWSFDWHTGPHGGGAYRPTRWRRGMSRTRGEVSCPTAREQHRFV